MTGSESLPSRLRTDLQANLPVAVTAAVWGMVGLFGAGALSAR